MAGGAVAGDEDVSLAVRPSWTRIIAARRRDRLIIAPMSLLAAAGGWIWVGPRFALAWLVGNLLLILCSHLFCAVIERKASLEPAWEISLAMMSAGMTAAYCALPFALMGTGNPAAQAAGLAMIGAIALSAGDEVVISWPIGGGSLAVSLIVGVAALLRPPEPRPAIETLLAIIAVLGFLGYVLQAAMKRRTLERRMEAALRSAVENEREAALANAAKSTFLATISHEIRTPLNGVIGMAQAMAADELTPRQRERLTVIRRSGEALTDTLNDVLDLSKIEAGHLELDHAPFELEEVLQGTQAVFSPSAAEKRLILKLDIEPEAAGAYRGDPARLRQMVYNLVSNAVKFTARGEVRVHAARWGDLLRIAVSDTGPGIAPHDQARLFRKFEQLDASATRTHGGAGLGLAICRELCELMGGAIAVESALGVGSTFTVALPLERLSQSPQRAEPCSAPSPEHEPADGLRILAAEDNPVNQTVLQALLGPVGLDPVIVGDGAQAVEAWSRGGWDLVLMDIQMPVMDGLAAVREIRRREQAAGLPRTPILALTANALAHQVAEVREAGMDGHVSKPIEVAKLFEAIAAATAGAAAREGS
jgi:signal transduction histidine kinase/ActR/RegA family two-component response regulator